MNARREIDPTKLHTVTAKAKVQTRRALPFEKHDPEAKRDRAFRFQTNAYERELFKYVAAVRGKGESASEVIRTFARERALRELGKVEVPDVQEVHEVPAVHAVPEVQGGHG